MLPVYKDINERPELGQSDEEERGDQGRVVAGAGYVGVAHISDYSLQCG